MSCRCPKTIAYLRSIGATHAAAMHESPDTQWSAMDWIQHMKEEEELLLPRLPREISEKIYADHVGYRDEIARYGRIISDTTRHSELEDAWVGVLVARQ